MSTTTCSSVSSVQSINNSTAGQGLRNENLFIHCFNEALVVDEAPAAPLEFWPEGNLVLIQKWGRNWNETDWNETFRMFLRDVSRKCGNFTKNGLQLLLHALLLLMLLLHLLLLLLALPLLLLYPLLMYVLPLLPLHSYCCCMCYC